ncbi:hypothetical protein P170DRAFT_431803 [Aspergillus steynii IBT 23096]|uniref:Secreted protein n=1 Tax=Aspergillus steynii IBT 23096 TaxID=1392250 RepID=A0A2I2GMS5_9EURO|nr:uncharacterized protein P170DRAFT_431803 [Aspergillus steynii IBT 23096]PLB54160.1 hypothetical protein P170DRAFT_431803 [Aspergillus steynii IBT 23096]
MLPSPLALQVIILAPQLISLSSSPSPDLSLSATVHNPSSSPVTVLRWNTPLDPRAGVLGVFEIHDERENQTVPIDTIKFNRKLPPSDEDLVEIAPESSVKVDVQLPPVKLQAGREYSLKAKGRWHGIWEGGKADVDGVMLDSLEGVERGEFESNVARVRVE